MSPESQGHLKVNLVSRSSEGQCVTEQVSSFYVLVK